MDVDWTDFNASFYLEAATKALANRPTFLNVHPIKYFLIYNFNLIAKAMASGYGMVYVVPCTLTYIYLFLNISIHFLLGQTWLDLSGEIFHAVTHIGVLSWIHDIEYTSFLPNTVVWYLYSTHGPAEFYLDCYVILTFLSYIWKKYCTRPHELTSLLCVLFSLNWVADQLVSGKTTSTAMNIIVFYLPLIYMDSFRTGNELKFIPNGYASMWIIQKISKKDLHNTPAGKLLVSLQAHFRGWSFSDYLAEIGKRKSFLNVNENEHYIVFNALLLLKSFIASYAVRYVIGVSATIKMMFANFLLALCDRTTYAVLAGFIRFIFITGYQYVLHIRDYHIAISSGIWYWVSCDHHFHFFLDIFLIIAGLVYIEKSYTDTSDRLSTIICMLYLVDWFGDNFIGEPLSTFATIVTLYIPVILMTASRDVKVKWRVSFMLTFIVLWFIFKSDPEFFAYGINKCLHNFYETAESIVKNMNDVLFM